MELQEQARGRKIVPGAAGTCPAPEASAKLCKYLIDAGSKCQALQVLDRRRMGPAPQELARRRNNVSEAERTYLASKQHIWRRKNVPGAAITCLELQEHSSGRKYVTGVDRTCLAPQERACFRMYVPVVLSMCLGPQE
uniref:Uncharacterized protein n=1 Tax=Octopus bimaculoides TaxID=37653 RepID=A0A0L8G735_OCTBM